MAAKTVFDHVNALFTNQRIDYFDTLSESDKKSFAPYMVNMAVGMNVDLVQLANEANKYWDQMDARTVYLFYSQVLPKGKRYTKWVKGKKDGTYEDFVVDIITKHYEISTAEAKAYLEIYYRNENGRAELKTLLEGYGIDAKKLKKAKLI